MSLQTSIALLATACRFPDAESPTELWKNVLEGRRSFRSIPSSRLDIARYTAETVGEAESITPIRAGLLTNWRFDRRRFKIPEKTFAATDLTHWLALELAGEAFRAIGGPDRLDRSKTAVVVANTMTGEFSRAALLRLRVPFLEDLLARAGDMEGLPAEAAIRLRSRFAGELRKHFPDPNEDSLAGGLTNTIAGRIANYFDLRGGAYSVDGACASSLVALADAANLLASGQADAVVVTAVDLSLDPFELIGFSRNGALAADEMRVFDANANGFWPGEGGACVLLMRENDAAHRGLPILARVRGWGLSTDGAGGLTRPSSEGQLVAYRRAYEMAGVNPADLTFVEAHGTGTPVGDPIEVRALAALREGTRSPLPIGSIKANIGHTKAAAGLAGLVKAVESLRYGIIPPHVSCETPHPVFAEVDNRIHPNLACVSIDDHKPALVGISSFGFGGINAHVVIERVGVTSSPIVPTRAPVAQDAELFLFSGDSAEELAGRIAAFERRAPTLSMAEIADAAAGAASTLNISSLRAAVVASQGSELAERLARAKAAVTAGEALGSPEGGVLVGRVTRHPRIGFLFPGQGAPSRSDGGLWRRRFPDAAELVDRLPTGLGHNSSATEIAQPAIVTASLAALRVLESLGISASIAAGHSLGEIAALVWAGALDRETALVLVRARGALMARFGSPGGGMLRVELPASDAEQLARDFGAVVACRNGRSETVLSGSANAIANMAAHCAKRGIRSTELAVSHAFHSPDMAPAERALKEVLKTVCFGRILGSVVSTVTGAPLASNSDLRTLLVDQLAKPVLFDSAADVIAAQTDFLIEVGPGRSLTRLVQDRDVCAMTVDALGDSLRPLLATVGALFVAGINVRPAALFDRPIRNFDPSAVPSFIESPCGVREPVKATVNPMPVLPVVKQAAIDELIQANDPMEIVLAAIMDETGLEASQLGADDRFLDALHLNSLAVTRIVTAAANALVVRIPSVPTEFANATPRLLAKALQELRDFSQDLPMDMQRIAGVRPWVRLYGMNWATASERPKDAKPVRWLKATLDSDFSSYARGDNDDGLLISIDCQLGATAAERLIALTAVAARVGISHLAVCHDGAPVAAFARSIAREEHFRSVRVMDRWGSHECDPRIATALSGYAESYYEIRLAKSGGLEEPVFRPKRASSCPSAVITADDVVVVVGGGKGITAECALHVGQCGAAVVLVGRSAADSPDVLATLARSQRKGLRCHYVQADVLDSSSLSAGVQSILSTVGHVTTLIYAPAENEPKRIKDLDLETIRRTLAPKTIGLETTLAILGPTLRRLITFSSIIGRIGLEGESHYALANAMQTAATEAWAAAEPDRTALAIEWSVWGGTGMGERLGTIERLSVKGVDAISVDDALNEFDKLIAQGATGTVSVTSRFGPPPGLSLGPSDFPLLRFIDEPKVHFPGVELVIETTLSRGSDSYLDDHVISGHAVLPAVIGLEAMAQVASALNPLGPHIAVRNMVLGRAVSLSAAGAMRVRIAALCSESGNAEVLLFAEDDGFATPCMQATFTIGQTRFSALANLPQTRCDFSAGPLYGPLFFGGKRFQRLERFELATSRQIAARLRPADSPEWFGPYEPSTFVLWEPSVTDAALHALQVAVPHRLVLPVGAELVEIDSTAGPSTDVYAMERYASAGTYRFDLLLMDANNHVAQRWTNVTFRAVDNIDLLAVLTAASPLAEPYLERVAREAFGDDSIHVAFVRDPNGTRDSRRAAALELFDLTGKVDRRVDGRPIRVSGHGSISIAHQSEITLAVMATTPISCDIETSWKKDEADVSSIQRHVAFEVCRKLGRRPAASSIRTLVAGRTEMVDDVELVVVHLPIPSGVYTVAFGRLKRQAQLPLQKSSFAIEEVTS